MKRLLSLLLILGLTLCACSSGQKQDEGNVNMSVALITDAAEIDDQSFNQAAYEACKTYCEKNGIRFDYFIPGEDSITERINKIQNAVSDGYNVLVLPGYTFAEAIVQTVREYPTVKFIAIDISQEDLADASGVSGFSADNLYCAIYQEEVSGYMAGYAAVKLGYTKLGFLGGVEVPSVQRYGYGYVKGADAAAAEVGEEIELRYVYGNRFDGSDQITAAMDKWYADGTEIIFSCGGDIYTSAAEAAAKAGGKLIGVDVDQKAAIDGLYGEGMTVTSAMKGIGATINAALTAINIDAWDEYAGQFQNLGIVSATNPNLNYVQIPLESTQWGYAFTQRDYLDMVVGIENGSIDTSVNITIPQPKADHIILVFEGTIG